MVTNTDNPCLNFEQGSLEFYQALLADQSAREKEQFEARLQQDSVLQQEVVLQRELKQGLSFLAQKDRFKQMHADLDKRGLLTETKIQPNQPVSIQPPFRYGWASWAMAASLVLLLGIGWVLYQNQSEKRQELAQNQRVFTTFFSTELEPAPVIPPDPDRVAASPGNGQSTQDSIRLHSAVVALQRSELQPTIRELTILSTGMPGHWSASAQWYLALAYIKNNQRTKAQNLLQTIVQLNGHPYQQKAQQLLRQLTSATSTQRP